MKVYSQIEVTLSKDNEISYVRYSDHMKEVHELRREVESGKSEISRLNSLLTRVQEAYADSKAEVERLREALENIAGGEIYPRQIALAVLNSQKIFDSSQEVQGEKCPQCNGVNLSWHVVSRIYHCRDCHHEFTITKGEG
jgi:predicted nuclease with TOPRIM domain